MYLSNPLGSNFPHAMQCDDIFKTYTKHFEFYKKRKPVTERRVKQKDGSIKIMRRAKRKKVKDTTPDLNRLPSFVFNRVMKYLFEGILTRKFYLKLPNNKGHIRMEKSKTPEKQFAKHKDIDLLKAGNRYYNMVMTLDNYYNVERYHYIHLTTHYREIYKEELYKGSTFQTAKSITLNDLAKLVHKDVLSDIDKSLISSIIKWGFKYITNGANANIDTVIYTQSENKNERVVDFAYISTNKLKLNRKDKFINKVRFLNDLRGENYSGYYYASLSHEEFNTFNKKSFEKKLYLYLEEALVNYNFEPHIIKVKISKPLYKRLIITKDIKYAKSNTEYIWRWDDKRFESVDNTKYVFNRRSKWNIDYV